MKILALCIVLITGALLALAMPVIESDPEDIGAKVQVASANLQAKENPWSLNSSPAQQAPETSPDFNSQYAIDSPPSDPASRPPSARPKSTAPTQPAKEAPSSWGSSNVILKRESDGHFYADAQANNGKVRLLVDTGATLVALTARDARKLGINWDQKNVRPVAKGAGGLVYGAHTVINRMKVGNIEARGVPAIIVPDGLPTSLLGQSFLSRVSTVTISGDQMELSS